MSELEAEYRFRLWLRHLWSSENCTVGVRAEVEKLTNHNAQFQALWLVGSFASASDSNNPFFTGS